MVRYQRMSLIDPEQSLERSPLQEVQKRALNTWGIGCRSELKCGDSPPCWLAHSPPRTADPSGNARHVQSHAAVHRNKLCDSHAALVARAIAGGWSLSCP